jgi:hypothetical protein
LKSKL